jgi:hypothetical protein
MTDVTQRFIVNLELVVTTDDYTDLDDCDVEHFIKREVQDAWNGMHDLDLESVYVRSIEETPTEPRRLVQWTAERFVEGMRSLAEEARKAD